MATASLQDFFKGMIFASGTPANYQNNISIVAKQNNCTCSPKEAIDNEWIKRPVLNIVCGDFEENFPNVIKSVLNREIKICKNEVFKPVILVNFPRIDSIRNFTNLPTVKEQICKKFHLITIHSVKEYSDDNVYAKVFSTIDDKEVDSNEAYEQIETIDDGCFNDNLPIIVCQVDMIGEGINVKSFNAIITSSVSDKKVMQQIGRGMRNYSINGKDKVHHGHCNVYAIYDNIGEVGFLIDNLAKHDLTDDCFDWGKKHDAHKGSGSDGSDNDAKKLITDKWEDIDIHGKDLQIYLRYTELNEKAKKKLAKNEIMNMMHWNQTEVDELMDLLKKQGYDKHVKNFNNHYEFFFDIIINIARLKANSEISQNVWKKDKLLFLKYMTKNELLAEFLNNNLTDKIKNAL